MSDDRFSWDCPWCGSTANTAEARSASWEGQTCQKCGAEVEISFSIDVDDVKVINDGDPALKLSAPEDFDPDQMNLPLDGPTPPADDGGKRTIHLSQSVRGALRNWRFPYDFQKIFKKEDGEYATAHEAREHLLECLSEGKEFLPMSDECVGFDFKNGCPGHRA